MQHEWRLQLQLCLSVQRRLLRRRFDLHMYDALFNSGDMPLPVNHTAATTVGVACTDPRFAVLSNGGVTVPPRVS